MVQISILKMELECGGRFTWLVAHRIASFSFTAAARKPSGRRLHFRSVTAAVALRSPLLLFGQLPSLCFHGLISVSFYVSLFSCGRRQGLHMCGR